MLRLPRLFCFDMDGTITWTASSWEHISRQLNIWDGLAEHHLKAFINKEIDYLEFCRLDASVLTGLESSLIRKALSDIVIDWGITALSEHLRSRGTKIALISSGLNMLAERVSSAAHFDYIFVNELEEKSGHMTGGVKVNVSIDDPGKSKKAIVGMIAAAERIERRDIAAIGDNWGDHGMLEEAGIRFFMKRSSEEAEKAKNAFPDIIIVESMEEIREHFACN